jgi:transcription-repair coupling factor (superfamily II helicase)
VDPYRGLAPHFRATSARAQALHALASGQARVLVASAPALLPRLASPDTIRTLSATLRPATASRPMPWWRCWPRQFEQQTVAARRVLPPQRIWTCSRRRNDAGSHRFVGGTVESIRRFDPSTQRSIETLDQFTMVPVRDFALSAAAPAGQAAASILDYLGSAQVVVAEPEDVRAQVDQAWSGVSTSYDERVPEDRRDTTLAPEQLMLAPGDIELLFGRGTALEELSLDEADGSMHVAYQPPQEFKGRIPDWVNDIRQALEREDTVLFVAGTRGRAERTVELLRDYDVRASWAGHADEQRAAGAVIVVDGQLSRGFRLPDAGFLVHAAGDVFEEERRRTQQRASKRSAAATFLSDLRDLKVGDFVT